MGYRANSLDRRSHKTGGPGRKRASSLCNIDQRGGLADDQAGKRSD